MPYVIKYKTTVSGLLCNITLRGIFEDGSYFGDIVVWKHHFSFSVEGYLRNTCVNRIFESIIFLTKPQKIIEEDSFVDCWISDFPISPQDVFFRHYANYKYDDETKHHYDILINSLKNEFDIIIQNKISKYQNSMQYEE